MSGSVMIDHFIINFMPTIRKIKIDLLNNRVTEKGEHPLHLMDLKGQKKKASEFLEIDDVILADYFMQ
jgi:hypothetical protein